MSFCFQIATTPTPPNLKYSRTCLEGPDSLGHEKYGLSRQVVFGDRILWITILDIIYKEYVVLRDRWSLMAVVPQDWFNSTNKL